MLSQDAIEEFRRLYHEEFGEWLTQEKAVEVANRLLRLFAAITRPKGEDILREDPKKPLVDDR